MPITEIVASAWESLLHEEHHALSPFVALAREDRVLGQLFPFTSMYTLRLSRCTKFPFDTDGLPNVTAKQYERLMNGDAYECKPYDAQSAIPLFVVTINNREYVGEGDVEVALKLVRDYLPDDIQPAVEGTTQ